MNDDDAIRLLDSIPKGADREGAHAEADKCLLDYLRAHDGGNVAEAYERARKRVGFWYA